MKLQITNVKSVKKQVKHKVINIMECHEIWEYNDEDKIQKLIGLISLCPISFNKTYR
jgi:hypothetical protein